MTRRRLALVLGVLVVVFLAFLVVVATAWWVAPRAAKGPPRGASTQEAPAIGVSVVTLPVKIPLSELEASLEKSLPQVFAEEKGKEIQDGLYLDLVAKRTGKVELSEHDGALVAEIPAQVIAKAYSGKRSDTRSSAPAGATVVAKLVLRADMTLRVSDDWLLLTKTKLSHRWSSKPTVQVGPFKFGIEKLADRMLAEQWPRVAKDIDDKRKADTSMREGLEQAWAELATPQKVSEAPVAWFVGKPEKLFAAVPQVEPRAIRLVVGLQGRFAIVVGDPGPKVRVPKLPARENPPATTGFRLALPARLSWDAVSDAAEAQLGGTTWTGSGGSLTVHDVEVYPSGDRVVLALGYEAGHAWRSDGTLYLWGRPVVDRDARVLRIEDFDFGVDTWDDAVATAGGLAGSTLREAAAEHLTFPFGDELDAAKKQAAAGLTRTTPEGHRLRGEVTSLELGDVRLTDEAMFVDTVAAGTLSVTLSAGGM